MSINVQSDVQVYEKDGEETVGLEPPRIKVLSHWNRSNFVVLEVSGHKYSVVEADLIDAIHNATRTGSR